jgi:hypothetical protein
MTYVKLSYYATPHGRQVSTFQKYKLDRVQDTTDFYTRDKRLLSFGREGLCRYDLVGIPPVKKALFILKLK